ncbi:alpha/beta fold hydrolase [Methylobacterium sp. A54F]
MELLPGLAAGPHASATPPIDPRALPRRFAPTPDGHAIAYVEAGTGPDVVLIHGTLMTLEDMWLGPMSSLAARYRVLAVDRPGHGLSRRARLTDASPWRQAELLRGALRLIGVRRPILIGHSYGGAVALAQALAFPDDVAAVLALAPVCFPEPRLEHVLFGPRAVPAAGNRLSALLHGSLDPALLAVLWRSIYLPQTMPERVVREFPFRLAAQSAQMVAEGENAMALVPALTRSALAYPTCRVPVHILGGTADIVVNNALHGATAAALLPQGRFGWVHGAGHMLHHSHVQVVVEALRAMA